MKELHNLLSQFCFLVILIMILIFIKEYPTISKHNLMFSFNKI